MPTHPGSTTGQTTRSGTQTLASLLIVIHLFFVAAALLGSHRRSELTGRLLSRFAFYTRQLNIDLNPDFASYHLTHATEADVDHRIEVLPEDSDAGAAAGWVVLSGDSFRGGERYKRYQRLARYLGQQTEDDANAARVVRGVGEHFLHARATSPRQIRCRRHLLQDWEVIDGGTPAERDPNSELYFRVPYAANCVILSSGRVNVIKVESAGDVAPPRQLEMNNEP